MPKELVLDFCVQAGLQPVGSFMYLTNLSLTFGNSNISLYGIYGFKSISMDFMDSSRHSKNGKMEVMPRKSSNWEEA